MTLVMVSVAVGVKVAFPKSASADHRSYEVRYDRGVSSFWVHPYTTSLTFEVQGASGQNVHATDDPALGGVGALVRVTFPLGHGYQVGDTLTLVAGSTLDAPSIPLNGGSPGVDEFGTLAGRGGGGSGVFNERTGRWLVVAGGGGGAGGGGMYDYTGDGGGNADASAPSGTAQGGAIGTLCSEGASPAAAGNGNRPTPGLSAGAGGGGGGGCGGGGGGGGGATLVVGGGGGGGGRSFWAFQARNTSRTLGARGDGYVTVAHEVYFNDRPEILAPSRVTWTVGEPVALDVVGVGSPPPDVRPRGALPAGVRMSVPLFSGRLEMRGTPGPGSEGRYQIDVDVENQWGRDSTSVTIEVVSPT
jgi:hypothetical protein